MRIEIVLFDGFDELDAIGPFEVFDLAVRLGAPLTVALVSLHGPGTVTAAHGTTLQVAETPDGADALLVPGGGWVDGSPNGVRAEIERGTLSELLVERADTVQWIGSVCTGALALADAGLLDGRRATTNRHAHDDLRAHGVEVVDSRVVDEGRIVTAAGITAGLDLALHLVEREAGIKMSRTIADLIEYTLSEDVWTTAARWTV